MIAIAMLLSCQVGQVYPSQVSYAGRWYSAPSCSSPYCGMCTTIRAKLTTSMVTYEPRLIVPAATEGQEPSSPELISAGLSALQLGPNDVLADIGCGDGRVLIAAVQRYGCRGVGVEIDSKKATEAYRAVKAAGLAGHITILRGSARLFQPEQHGVTHAYAYLQPSVLEEIIPVIDKIPVTVSIHHAIPGRIGDSIGPVWLYRSSMIQQTLPL